MYPGLLECLFIGKMLGSLDWMKWTGGRGGVFILRVENDIPAYGSLCLVLGTVDRRNDGKATSELII